MKQAAVDGDPVAQFQLADMYERGERVDHDLRTALQYLRLSAERGYGPAQYRLGLYKSAGVSTPEQLVEGYFWLTLATKHDAAVSALADSLRAALTPHLSELQLREAEAQVAEFAPSEGPVPVDNPIRLVLAPTADTLQRFLPTSDCGQILVSQDSQSRFHITGYVRAGQPDISLGGDWRTYISPELVETHTRELDDGLCDVLSAITPYAQKIDVEGPVVLRDEESASTQVFRDGAHVILDIQGFDEGRFITVDFFLQGGHVIHMLPNSATKQNYLRAGQSMVLGRPGAGQKTWQIGPPFGDDLIVVFSSKEPLADGWPGEIEKIHDYLARLSHRLTDAASSSKGKLQAFYQVVKTVPQ